MAEIIKRRTLRLLAGNCERGETNIGDLLSRMDGVKSAGLDAGAICVEYDLLKVRFSEIEAAIERSGYGLTNTLPARLKRAIIRTMEQNEYENMTQKPSPCCSNPREILDAAKKRHL